MQRAAGRKRMIIERRFVRWKMPLIHHNRLTAWNWMCAYPQFLKLGKNTDIGAFTYINARYGVEIGDGAQIGGGCFIYSHDTISNKKGRVVIGKGAKIGAQCTILPGVTIGKGALVGAHTLVNKNIPPNALAYGTPVKVKRK